MVQQDISENDINKYSGIKIKTDYYIALKKTSPG